MATGIDKKNIGVSYSNLIGEWAPYLTEKHAKELKEKAKTVDEAYQNPQKSGMQGLISALERMGVFHKRVQKRQAEIAHISDFMKGCDQTLFQLEDHQRRLKQMESEKKEKSPVFETCMNCTDNYRTFTASLKALAQKTLAIFNERKFDKGVRAAYPQMMQDFSALLKKADLFEIVKTMPEHKIQKDLLFFFDKGGTPFQVPKKGEFDSIAWILTLKAFSKLAAEKLLVTPEMLEHEQKTDTSQKKQTLSQKEISELEEAISKTPQFLSTVLARCNEKCEKYARQKASETKEHITAYLAVCLAYFTGLKGLIEQTQAAFQKNGAEGVKAVYPGLVKELVGHVKKAGMVQLLDDMPSCPLKNHLQAAMKEQPIDTSNFKIDDWSMCLLGFQGQGEHLLCEKAFDNLDVLSDLIDRVTEP